MGLSAAWNALWSKPTPAGIKASAGARLLVQLGLGNVQFTPRRTDALADEGYRRNIIVYRCVRLIAQNAAAVPWLLFRKGRTANTELASHEVLNLLTRPNPSQGGAQLFEALFSSFLIAGNSYLEGVGPSLRKVPRELWVMRPDRMSIMPGATGIPKAFRLQVGGQHHDYPVDPTTGASPILHSKSYNPLDDWYGMSPLEAAGFSVDQHNAAGKWNAALLMNEGRPSGALVYAPRDPAAPDTLTDKQRANIRAELEEVYTGPTNAGRPLILEGGLSWVEMSLSPADMSWSTGKSMSATEIALAYHVPPQLVGVEGSLTFANFEQARLSLYEDAVLPLLDFFRDELNRWLVPVFGDGLQLDYDADSIPALSVRRERTWDKVATADFLTVNEKREAVGYEPVDSGDVILVPATMIPLGEEPPEPEPKPDDPGQEGDDDQGDGQAEGDDPEAGGEDEPGEGDDDDKARRLHRLAYGS